MITMIGQLISDGEVQRQAAIDSEASAQSDTDAKTAAFEEAEKKCCRRPRSTRR